ncbi:superoxide dismutase [Roridomyces roridus]|uniref:Superoxide dismutase [Cu-Zn] n=1 Tax=Roridomyces roridus TaxID=1738132 RepID=A0AAD7CB85_9AGAR|nr:superoxide dismutase [Roridomyces roridus]
MDYTPKQQKSTTRWWFLGAACLVTLVIVLSRSASKPDALPVVTKAVVVLKGSSSATGTVTFEQKDVASAVTVTGKLQGLDANAERGFHIHQFGDLTDGCLSAGPHFNPFAKNHGAPSDAERHVGDLGNIQTDGDGKATFSFEDSTISLNGPLSIVGRAVVLHAGTDDLGKGGDPESLKTGNAGARAACGTIGLAA